MAKIGIKKLIQRAPGFLARSEIPAVRWAYFTGRKVARGAVHLVSPLQPGWISHLVDVSWTGPTTLEIYGWAYERGVPLTKTPQVEVALHAHGKRAVAGQVTMVNEPRANAAPKVADYDLSVTGFRAEFDVTGLPVGRWWVHIKVRSDHSTGTGTFLRRMGLGSAFNPQSRLVGDRVITPGWHIRAGLTLRVRKPKVLATQAVIDGRELRVACREGEPLISLDTGGSVVPKLRPGTHLSQPDDDGFDESNSVTLPGDWLPMSTYRVLATDSSDKTRPVSAAQTQFGVPERLPFLYAGYDATLRVLDAQALVVVTETEVVESPELGVRIAGKVLGAVDGLNLRLVGPRATRSVTADVGDDGSFTAFGSWLAPEWGRPARPPLPGIYTLQAGDASGANVYVMASDEITSRGAVMYYGAEIKCRLGVFAGRRLAYRVLKPTRDDELGGFNQSRLQREYTSGKPALRDTFFFESFYGTQATCNPYGLDRDIATRFPDIPRYWGIADASVAVPEGAIPVIEGTVEWWEARQRSRYVVANDWLRGKFERMPGQRVLQTWHGSMLKRIGLDRIDADIIYRRQLLAETKRWSFLLSQNPDATKVWHSAYAWTGEIWEEGYPRNDALFNESGEPIRELLGIQPGQKAILYAPTWREGTEEVVLTLDAARLAKDLGDEYVVLLRSHARTMKFGEAVRVPGVIDVTTYPNITDLFLAADALITDYSSVMFDYSNTRRPMIFFVPDMDQYRDSERGVYFDLSELAPGPVLATHEEVLAAVRAMEKDEPQYAAKYDAWRARFNPWDDGHVAQRINDRLLENTAHSSPLRPDTLRGPQG
ncbi:MAG: CDP-glycerol glycerophosphotransferase family protein [Propionibacteriaceae bacterium]|nr:CDP-glycerol glycerophosphotransferase family protein [Propionibacteriaceae bacterium]